MGPRGPGGQIYTCRPCLNKRELDGDNLVPGAIIFGGPKPAACTAGGVPSISY